MTTEPDAASIAQERDRLYREHALETIRPYLLKFAHSDPDTWNHLPQDTDGPCGEPETGGRLHGCGTTTQRWIYGALSLCRHCIAQRAPHNPAKEPTGG